MPEKKNQHYVPKLHLRSFSINGEGNQIGMFNLRNGVFRSKVGLKNQAQEDYFYGKDGFWEEELSKLEDVASPVLKEIIFTNSLPKIGSEKYLQLFVFSIVMAQRTKDVVEQVKEMTDKLWRTAMGYDERFKDKIDDLRIYPKNPASLALNAVLERIHWANDLRLKLIINNCDTPFLTSDHPVVKYNQFLEQRKHPGGKVGLAIRGLQIFYSISPIHMLCFYDDWVYKIGSRKDQVIITRNKQDIEQLNYLQSLNCYEHLYFNEAITESYVQSLAKRAILNRPQEYTTLRQINSYTDMEGQEHISFMTGDMGLSINLNLSFVSQTKKAKEHILSDYVAQLRDESLRGQGR